MAGRIRRLDQVRALANPLRLRMLDALVDTARTPMEVAELLGRKPTSLYHHMRVLERAGLVRQTGTQKRRGATARFYRAVHTDVRIDPRTFSTSRGPTRVAWLASVVDALDEDVRRLGAVRVPMLALRLTLPVDPARLAELEQAIRAWANDGGAAQVSYHVSVVAYPDLAGTEAGAPRTEGKTSARRQQRPGRRRTES